MNIVSLFPFNSIFPPQTTKVVEAPLAIRGELPAIQGEIFFNGPGEFGRGAFRYKHWLDGDGFIQKISLGPTPTVSGSFVETVKRVEEDRAGRPVFRTFGTKFIGDQVSIHTAIESPANVNVSAWGANLLAWGEGGLPYEVDPANLSTLQQWNADLTLSSFERLSGHPKVCPDTGAMLNFSMIHEDDGAYVLLREFPNPRWRGGSVDQVGGSSSVDRVRIPLDGAHSIHDFAVTTNFVFIVLHSHFMDRNLVMKRGRTALEAMTWTGTENCKLLVVPRRAPQEHFSISIPAAYVIHWINAAEQGSTAVLDFIEYENPLYSDLGISSGIYSKTSPGSCRRLRVDLEHRSVVSSESILNGERPDFPVSGSNLIQDESSNRFWCLGMSRFESGRDNFFDQLLQGQFPSAFSSSGPGPSQVASKWIAPSETYLCGEPVLVQSETNSNKNEGSGLYIGVQYFNAESNERGLHFFPAVDISAGPVCSLIYPGMMPFGMHGFWRRT